MTLACWRCPRAISVTSQLRGRLEVPTKKKMSLKDKLIVVRLIWIEKVLFAPSMCLWTLLQSCHVMFDVHGELFGWSIGALRERI